MNRTLCGVIVALGVVSLSIARLGAGPMGFASIPKLTSVADAVIVGAVQQSTVTGQSITLKILVIRSLKGALVQGDSFYAEWTSPTINSKTNALGLTGVWFLSSPWAEPSWAVLPTAVGDVNLSNAYLPVPGTPLDSDHQVSANATVVDKIANEVVAALDASNGQSPLMLRLQLGALDITNSPVYQQALARFSNSGTGPLQSVGLQNQIRAGDTSSLAKLANTTELQSDPAFALAVCEYRSADPSGVASLGALVDSRVPSALRGCAAHALRGIHTASTLAYLVSLLDSDLSDLRYEGVAGLASFANNLPIQTSANTASMAYLTPQGKTLYTTPEALKSFPGKQLFLQQEATYIGFWKSWWAAHQADF